MPNPIRISDEQIAKYKEIFFKTHGVKLTKEHARSQGMALIATTKVLARQAQNN